MGNVKSEAKKKTKQLSVRFTLSTYNQLKKISEETNKPLAELINDFVVNGMKKQEEKDYHREIDKNLKKILNKVSYTADLTSQEFANRGWSYLSKPSDDEMLKEFKKQRRNNKFK